jgi:hypothetical protein
VTSAKYVSQWCWGLMEQDKRYRRSQSDKIQVEQRWMGVWGGKSLVSGGNARRSGVTGAESYGRMYRADTAPDHSVMMGRSRKKVEGAGKAGRREKEGGCLRLSRKGSRRPLSLGAETTATQLVQCHLAAWGLKAFMDGAACPWVLHLRDLVHTCATSSARSKDRGETPECVRVCRLFACFTVLAISNVIMLSLNDTRTGTLFLTTLA